jgi:hypothetical protein
MSVVSPPTMPSVLHEGLVMLFRERPTLARELLEQALGASIGEFVEARIESSEIGDVVPAEYRAVGEETLRRTDARKGVRKGVRRGTPTRC